MSYPNVINYTQTNKLTIDDVRETCQEEQSILKSDILNSVKNVLDSDETLSKYEPLTQSITRAIGDFWFSIDGTIPSGGLPHLGHLVNRSTYSEFYLWIEGTKTILSDAEWLSYAESHGGCCPYYSSGDGSTTFRTPSYDQSFLKVLSTISETGKWEKAGLPAHYHKIFTYKEGGSGNNDFVNFITSNAGTVSGYMNYTKNYAGEIFNSSIYGNSDTVTPQNFGILVGVYAVGAIVPVGTTDAQKIMSGVTRVEGLLDSKIDKISIKSYVIEHYQNGTDWYRVYSDGWIEQGGRIINTTSSGTVTFAKPFSNTNYTCTTVEGDKATAETASTDTGGYADNMGITDYTPSSFRYSCTAGRYFNYYACGY